MIDIPAQVSAYLTTVGERSRADMQALHKAILAVDPKCRLWFSDGTDDKGRVVSNPSIGYGVQTIKYANRGSKEFFRVGISANSSGISVYIMSIKDKAYLTNTYGAHIGKARVTGYCIKFKKLTDIDLGVLEAAIRDGLLIHGA